MIFLNFEKKPFSPYKHPYILHSTDIKLGLPVLTVKVLRVQLENGLENVFFLHFLLVSMQFDIS